MIVDRQWAERNLGFDPLTTPAPLATFSTARGARPGSDDDLRREIIDFDSEAPHGREFLAFSRATGLSRYTDVPWPKGLAPKTGDRPRSISGSALPRADVLIVTWTVDEGHALSRVLDAGQGLPRRLRALHAQLCGDLEEDAQRLPGAARRIGWARTGPPRSAKNSVVVFKSDSHMSQDGPQLPNIDVWRQIIEEVQPGLVITTGTAGRHRQGIRGWRRHRQPDRALRLHLQIQEGAVRAGALCERAGATTKHFAAARKLFKANAAQLPKDNTRPAKYRSVAPDALNVFGRDYRFLRLRYVRRSLSAAGPRRRLRDGRRGARARRAARWERRRRAGSRSETSPTRRSRPTG